MCKVHKKSEGNTSKCNNFWKITSVFFFRVLIFFMIFESFTLLVMDIIIFKIKNYSVLVIYILDVYGLRLYCIWIAFMAWFAFCLKISNSWFYSVTFLKGYFKYSFIFHPLKNQRKWSIYLHLLVIMKFIIMLLN